MPLVRHYMPRTRLCTGRLAKRMSSTQHQHLLRYKQMMLRCGIDTIEISRIQEGIQKFGERFLRRFFTDGERADCADMPSRLAARFACKEAVAKALGTGIGDVRWVDIEIRNSENGRPILNLYGEAIRLSHELGITQWDVSLTHTKELATAMAVAL